MKNHRPYWSSNVILVFPAQVLGDDGFLSTCGKSILCPDGMKTLDKLDGRNGPYLQKLGEIVSSLL